MDIITYIDPCSNPKCGVVLGEGKSRGEVESKTEGNSISCPGCGQRRYCRQQCLEEDKRLHDCEYDTNETLAKRRIEKLKRELTERPPEIGPEGTISVPSNLQKIRDLCVKQIGKNKDRALIIVVPACFKEGLALKYPFSPLASTGPLEVYRKFLLREIKDIDVIKEERYIIMLLHPEKESGIISCYSFSIER